MNPLRLLARSRLRLVVSAVVGATVLFFASAPMADYIRHDSTSPIGDLGLITLFAFGLLVTGVLIGVLIGDFIFRGRWRERVILGLDVEEEAPKDEDEEIALALKGRPGANFLPLAAIVVAVTFGGLQAFEARTDGFFAEFQRIGFVRTKLRTHDDDAKIALIYERARVKRPVFVRDSRALLDGVRRDPGQSMSVRVAAVRGLGRLFYSLRTSADTWAKMEEYHGHWEVALLRQIGDELVPSLLEEREGADPAMGSAIDLALAKLRSDDIVERLVGTARDPAADPELWRAAVAGLGLIRDLRGLEPMVDVAPKLDDIGRLAVVAWSAGEIARHWPAPEDGEAPPVFERLVEVWGKMAVTGDFEQRCLAADVLGKTGDARMAPYIFKAFEAADGDKYCQTMHVDIDEAAPVTVSGEQRLRVRLLLGIQYIARGNEDVLSWAERSATDPRYEKVAHHLRTLVESGRYEGSD